MVAVSLVEPWVVEVEEEEDEVEACQVEVAAFGVGVEVAYQAESRVDALVGHQASPSLGEEGPVGVQEVTATYPEAIQEEDQEEDQLGDQGDDLLVDQGDGPLGDQEAFPSLQVAAGAWLMYHHLHGQKHPHHYHARHHHHLRHHHLPRLSQSQIPLHCPLAQQQHSAQQAAAAWLAQPLAGEGDHHRHPPFLLSSCDASSSSLFCPPGLSPLVLLLHLQQRTPPCHRHHLHLHWPWVAGQVEVQGEEEGEQELPTVRFQSQVVVASQGCVQHWAVGVLGVALVGDREDLSTAALRQMVEAVGCSH